MHTGDSELSGQPPARTTSVSATKRPCSPWRSSHAGPSSPSRNAVLAATSAARQVAAQTVTACQRTSAGGPVDGSIRWWARSPPSRSHDLVVMPLVASAPELSVTVPPAGSATTSSPRVARSPPAETKPSPSSRASASSTARPLTTPLRSSRRPTGRWTRRPASRISRQRPAGTAFPSGPGAISEKVRS